MNTYQYIYYYTSNSTYYIALAIEILDLLHLYIKLFIGLPLIGSVHYGLKSCKGFKIKSLLPILG